jgi:hypothetical protein
MSVRRAVAVSAAIHVLVIVAIATQRLEIPRAPLTPEAPEPPVPNAPPTPTSTEPIEIILLEPDAPVPAHPLEQPPALTKPVAPHDGSRIETERGRTRGTANQVPGTFSADQPPAPGPGAGTDLMKMRGPELALSERAVDDFLARSKPREQAPRSGRLRREGGKLIARDSQVPATVHEDGTVTFDDKSAFALGRGDEKGAPDPGVDEAYGPGEGADRNTSAAGATGVGGQVDVTAYAMRKFGGGDPYASRKRKLLADTFDERAELGKRHAIKQLGRSAELMRQNVARVWHSALSPAARREALFSLWDECAEGEGEQGDAGKQARAVVIGWIRGHVARGTADEFTPAEITAFNARRASKQPFAPYET